SSGCRLRQSDQPSSGVALSILLVIVVATTGAVDIVIIGAWRGAELVLVQRDQPAEHSIVQLERALVLRQRTGLGVESCDDVGRRVAVLDLVGELATAPVVERYLFGVLRHESVEARELLIDGIIL